MSGTKLPGPFQLCLIAAALRGGKTTKKPEESVKEAMILWFASAHEIHEYEEIQRVEFSQKGAEEFAAKKANQDPDSELILIASPDGKSSPALEWITEHEKEHREKFKTIGRFKDAWGKFRSGADNFYDTLVPIGELRDFLRWRKRQRLDLDKERKRKGRENKKPKRRSAK